LDVTWVHRETKDRPVLIDINGIYEDGVFKGYKNPNFNQIYLVTNNQWNWLVYSGLDVSIAKQGGRVQWLASYNHQWRRVARTFGANDPPPVLQADPSPPYNSVRTTRRPPSR